VLLVFSTFPSTFMGTQEVKNSRFLW